MSLKVGFFKLRHLDTFPKDAALKILDGQPSMLLFLTKLDSVHDIMLPCWLNVLAVMCLSHTVVLYPNFPHFGGHHKDALSPHVLALA